MEPPPVKPRSWLFDLFGDYVEHRPGRKLGTGSIIALGAEFDLTERAMRSALLRLQRDGWVDVDRAAGRSSYGLTDAGRALIDRGRERILRGPEHNWDGQWAVLAYSIPEARRDLRDRLRRELGWLGCGAIGSGLFISPRLPDVAALATRYDLPAGAFTVFQGRQLWPGDDRSLAGRCWDLARLNERYLEFCEAFRPYCRPLPMSDQDCFVVRFRLINAYRRLPFDDPGLPAELLPEEWQGFPAMSLFQDLHERLAPGANCYYDSLTAPSGVSSQPGFQATSQA
ncbi:MAG: PaaX family transcriptional regulator [Chloroflexi bacterium]|nr:PaaX family transcriptional regulator [Chloroflexota bacterium]